MYDEDTRHVGHGWVSTSSQIYEVRHREPLIVSLCIGWAVKNMRPGMGKPLIVSHYAVFPLVGKYRLVAKPLKKYQSNMACNIACKTRGIQ